MSLNHFMSISSKKMDRVGWEITKLVNGRNWMVPLLQETLCENHGGIQPLTSLLTENRSDAVYLFSKGLGRWKLKTLPLIYHVTLYIFIQWYASRKEGDEALESCRTYLCWFSMNASKTDADTLTAYMMLHFQWKTLGWNKQSPHLAFYLG